MYSCFLNIWIGYANCSASVKAFVQNISHNSNQHYPLLSRPAPTFNKCMPSIEYYREKFTLWGYLTPLWMVICATIWLSYVVRPVLVYWKWIISFWKMYMIFY